MRHNRPQSVYGKTVLLFVVMVTGFWTKAGFAEAMTSELASRFQKMETQIIELQKQMSVQNQRHQEEILELRKQIEIKGPEEKAVYLPPASTGAMPKWLEGLEMGGDLRLRYDAFKHNEATRDRNRFRYRLRWKIEKHVTEDLDLGFRFASGSSTDPTSTNQTFTGDFTYKSIFIDQVYAKYRPSFLKDHIASLEKIEIGAGKFENPFARASSSMVWDGDVTPEGAYQSLEFGWFNGKLKPFVNLGQFVLQESATLADAEMYGAQAGIRWTPPGFGEKSETKLTHALAYYDFSDYTKNSNFIVSGTSLARGNSVSGTRLFAGDFDILQVYNDIQFKIGGFPVKVFADYAANLADQTVDPLNRNDAYEYGIRLGNAKQKGDWEVLYYYANVEPNAVVGAFSDSDFGLGHANKRGSSVQLKYKLTDALKVGLNTYFVNNITGVDDETRRFSTDLEWVF